MHIFAPGFSIRFHLASRKLLRVHSMVGPLAQCGPKSHLAMLAILFLNL